MSWSADGLSVVGTSFARLIQEHVHLPTALEESVGGAGLETVWCDMVQDRAVSLAEPDALLATQCYIDVLIGGKETSGHSELRVESDLILMGKRLHERGLLDKHCFSRQLIRSIESLPLSMVVSLIKEDLLNLSDLLERESIVSGYLTPGIVSLTQTGTNHTALQDLISWIVIEGFPTENVEASNVDTAQQLLSTLISETYREGVLGSYSILQAVCDCEALDQDTRYQLASQLLTQRMTSLSCSDTVTAVEIVLDSQQTWQYSTLPEHLRMLYSDVCRLSEDLLSVLCSTIACNRKLNWTSVLSFLSTFLNSSELAIANFKVALKDLLKRSLSENLPFLFRCAIVFARQAGLEGRHIHPSYETWFKDMFGTGLSSVIKRKRDLQLVMKWLTELVPYESPDALKAHVQSPPSSRFGMSVVNDYIVLAKTRLSDLKVPLDSMQTTSSAIPHAEVEKANADVEKAISKFTECNQVPEFLRTMSFINKPYYVGRFLRCLLSPSSHGNIEKENLINELAKEKRIPPSMLTAYRQASVAISRDDSPPPDNVTVELINKAMGRESSLSTLSKLSAHLSKEMNDPGTHINIQAPGLPAEHVQVVDTFVSKVCQCVCENNSHGWIAPLLSMLSQHTAFYKALFVRLWELLHNQLHLLTESHLFGLGVLCASLWLAQDSLNRPLTFESTELQTVHSLADCTLSNIPTPSQSRAVQGFLYFCLHFTQTVLSSLATDERSIEIGPKSLLTKLRYIHTRAGHTEGERKMDHCIQLVQELTNSDIVKRQWDSYEPPFCEWLMWELQCDPSTDYLGHDERAVYMRERVYTHYIPHCGVNTIFVEVFQSLSTCEHAQNYSQGVAILQEISTELTPGSPPCLLTAINKAVGDGGRHTATFVRVVSLVCSLPVHLLWSNSFNDKQTSFNEIISTLQNLKALSCVFVLPLSLTLHICPSMTDLFVSPLYHTSILCHWPKLIPLLPAIQTPLLIPQAQWLHNKGPLPMNFDPLTFGVCIFHLLNGYHSDCIRTDLERDFQQWTGELEAEKKEQLAMVTMDCCVRDLAGQYFALGQQQRLVDIAQVVLEECPVSIVACVSDTQHAPVHSGLLDKCRTCFPTCCDVRFLPIILFHLLSEEPLMINIMKLRPSLLPLVVTSHKETLDLAGADQQLYTSVQLVQKATRVTKIFITSSPDVVVQETLPHIHPLLKPWLGDY